MPLTSVMDLVENRRGISQIREFLAPALEFIFDT